MATRPRFVIAKAVRTPLMLRVSSRVLSFRVVGAGGETGLTKGRAARSVDVLSPSICLTHTTEAGWHLLAPDMSWYLFQWPNPGFFQLRGKKTHVPLASAYTNPHLGGRSESFERKRGASVAILRLNLSSVNIKVDRIGQAVSIFSERLG